MTDHPETLLPADEPPTNYEWVDTCDALAAPTDWELAEGKALGETINPDNDEDGGTMRFGLLGAISEQDRARSKARLLKRIMLDHGVPEVSIELQPGRPNAYGSWDALYCVGEMSHHTVSTFSTANRTPVLALVKNGRSDLPGPLSNGYGGWDLTYRIITFGYANHPGAGGPLTIPAFSGGTYTIPKDSARRYLWGTEWEGGIRESDWDRVLTNPRNDVKMTMREFMGRANAALRAYHEIVYHCEHSTWTGRKIDRLGYSAQEGTDELKKYEMKEPVVMPVPPRREPLSFITANVFKENRNIEDDLRLLVKTGAFAIGLNEAQRFDGIVNRVARNHGYRVYGADYGTAILLHEEVCATSKTIVISDAVGTSPRRKLTEVDFTLHGDRYVIQNCHMNSHVQAGQNKPQIIPRVDEYIDGMKIVTGRAKRHREAGKRVVTLGDMNWAWSKWDLRQWYWSPQRAFMRRTKMKCQFDYEMLVRPKGDERAIEYVFFHPEDFAYRDQRFVGPEHSDHPYHEVTLRPRG